jgi:hypothetical protein
MKKTINYILTSALLVVTLTFLGCEVFVDFGLKDATFENYDAIIPGFGTNLNTLLLPGYVEDNPDYRYIVKYFGNERCTGEYYAADTLQYKVEGTWSLIEPDLVQLQLDAFISGVFKISKLDKTTYLLETDANEHGLGIEPHTLPLQLYNRKIY